MSPRVQELAGALVDSGVGLAAGVTGSGLSWQLITALERLGVPFVPTVHESAAAILAGAFARHTGSLGCAITIKGPGFANLLPGIVSNAYEAWPVLTVSEAYGPARGARRHKLLDHETLARACVRAYGTLGDPRTLVPSLAAAARADVPGPVHLDLFAEEHASFWHVAWPASPPWAPAGEAERLLTVARRPVVIAGAWSVGQPWARSLASLGVPVMTTLAAKGVVDERTTWAGGIYTGDGKSLAPERALVEASDLVVGVGLRADEVLSVRPFGRPTVLYDTVWTEGVEAFGGVRCHASGGAVETALGLMGGRSWGAEEVDAATTRLRSALLNGSWLPATVFASLQAASPAPSHLVVDTGLFCTVAEHLWQAGAPAAFTASANGRYMGTSVPMALGVALAHPADTTICAMGDGGARMGVAELAHAIERHLRIAFVLMSDARYGSVGGVPGASGLSERAVTIARPSWFRAIEAMGCPAGRVESRDELERAFAAWSREGPLFIEAVFDPAAYARATDGLR
ncbi:MAG: thiamine pyrophosphate-dependent enzyme [Vicinamibacterales bacterium]